MNKKTTKTILLATTLLAMGAGAPAFAQISTIAPASTSIGTIYGFGDSLLDTRFLCALPSAGFPNRGFGTCSTGRGALQWLPEYAPYTFNNQTNFAVGGARTGTFSPFGFPGTATQVSNFLASGARIGANDLVVLSGFPNNRAFLFPPNPPISGAALGQRALAEQSANIQNLINAGARNIVVYGMARDARPTYLLNNQVTSPEEPAYGSTVRDNLPATLAQFARPGVQLRLFEYNEVYRRAIENPAQYGFGPVVTPCVLDPACRGASAEVQNQRFLYDIHPTEAGHRVLARYIAALISAQDSIPAQVEVTRAVSTTFANSIFGRLDAFRDQNQARSVPAAFSADLPSRTVAPTPVPVVLGSPVAVFVQATYGTGRRDERFNGTGLASGFDYDTGGGTVGVEYRASPNALLGLAFNYSRTETDVRRASDRLEIDSYQFAGYASFSYPNWFTDVVLTYGRHDLDVRRAGVIDVLRATPEADTFTAGATSAYLFDVGAVRAGPLVGLRYENVSVGSYTETGDPILTQFVRRQTIDTLTGSAGVQIRLPFVVGARTLSPFLNLTAEHDFLGRRRFLITSQTSALELPIYTPVSAYGSRTYGKVAGGIAAEVSPNLSVHVAGEALFARSNSEDYAVTAGLRYRF